MKLFSSYLIPPLHPISFYLCLYYTTFCVESQTKYTNPSKFCEFDRKSGTEFYKVHKKKRRALRLY